MKKHKNFLEKDVNLQKEHEKGLLKELNERVYARPKGFEKPVETENAAKEGVKMYENSVNVEREDVRLPLVKTPFGSGFYLEDLKQFSLKGQNVYDFIGRHGIQITIFNGKKFITDGNLKAVFESIGKCVECSPSTVIDEIVEKVAKSEPKAKVGRFEKTGPVVKTEFVEPENDAQSGLEIGQADVAIVGPAETKETAENQ